ncbi:MAG TPA: maleylpyruvate isomerase N-terminal domain-containing protein [Acidimicrobiia bacterium]
MTIAWPELRSDLVAAAGRFASVVGALDPDEPVRGSDWSVGQTVAHVVTTFDRWVSMAEGAAFDIGRGPEFATRMAEINRREIEAAGRCGAGEETAAAARWLAVATDPDASMHLYGLADVDCSFAEASGVLLGELLMHGYDVARSIRAPWPITAREAIAVAEGLLPLLPLVYDGSATGGRSFDIDLRLRGRGSGIDFHCEPSALTISDGSPDRAAVHISADPAPWLLVGYGRRSQWRAAATGTVVAWGRKPWLALRFGRLLVPA